jgi:hypothetical protein
MILRQAQCLQVGDCVFLHGRVCYGVTSVKRVGSQHLWRVEFLHHRPLVFHMTDMVEIAL